MSKLKVNLQKNDYICQKTNPEDLYFVIKTDLHKVFLRRESDDQLLTIPKRMVNIAYMKVDPQVAKVLYSKMQEQND
jgi:hypothetical protein